MLIHFEEESTHLLYFLYRFVVDLRLRLRKNHVLQHTPPLLAFILAFTTCQCGKIPAIGPLKQIDSLQCYFSVSTNNIYFIDVKTCTWTD